MVLARQRGDSWQVADHFVLERPGLWGFAASPGTYGVVAFQDLNRDLKLQRDEPYLGVDNNRLITCKPGGRRTDLALRIPADGRSRFGETLDISALQVRTFDEQMDVSLTQVTAVGEISNLSDPRFDQAIAEDGLWRPFDFLFKGHPGVYFLGAYDSTKIPVLFVHGINGSPQNFKTLIERLDQRRFQPWVYYYPSGASLPNVAEPSHPDHASTASAVRLRLVRRGRAQHGRPGVARLPAALPRGRRRRRRCRSSSPSPRRGTGTRRREWGAKAPIGSARVFTDMAPNSEYLKSLYGRDPGVPHYLLYTSNDGTVTMESQLRDAAKKGAVSVEGFNETHMGVLDAGAVSERVNELLSRAVRK